MPDAVGPHAGHSQTARKRIDSVALFDGETEVLILHNGEQYRLRITRQDKLILTK